MHKFLLSKVTFTYKTSSIPENFLSHTLSCDWPETCDIISWLLYCA